MKKIDSFVNKYSLSKTLRFSLIPVGKTEENFDNKLLLEEDDNRAKAYERVKKYIDRYHIEFIESVMSDLFLDGIREYAQLYYKSAKDDKELSSMEKMETTLRKNISKALKGDNRYKLLFGKEMIRELLPQLLTDKKELEDVEMFYNFSTYFTGFYENRKNIYNDDIQNSIAYRCINENLPMFLDNALSFSKVKEALSQEELEEINNDFMSTYGVQAEDVFSVDYFNFVLAQSGIDKYNGVIGGYTCSDSTKIKGINEHINLYNQQIAKNDKSKRLPLMKPLYKQILSKKGTVSFVPEKFKSDDEVLLAINEFYTKSAQQTVEDINNLFAEFDSFDMNGIHLLSGVSITDVSNAVFGDWNAVTSQWNNEYELSHPIKKGKDPEKYYEDEKKEYKKNKSFALAEIQRLGSACLNKGCIGDVAEYYKTSIPALSQNVFNAYSCARNLLSNKYDATNKKLCKNEEAIEQIKTLLDAIKELEKAVKPLIGTGKEDNKDDVFYGRFIPLYKELSECDHLYDKVRNYITAKYG